MNEKSMYTTIMDLPLFKGISREQVSSFLEKTNLSFEKYSEGDEIVREGKGVSTLKFIISGSFKADTDFFNGRLKISSTFDAPFVLGVENLFGLDRTYSETITAVGNVSVMAFSKEKYIRLLNTDNIYLINYCNYLSMNVQKSTKMMRMNDQTGLCRVIMDALLLLTKRESRDIEITMNPGMPENLKREFMYDRELKRMAESGLAIFGPQSIRIPDRDAVIDYIAVDEISL